MTPGEAEGFYEDDEDPREVFARFDAGPHCVTVRPGYSAGGYLPPDAAHDGTDAAEQVRQCRDYIRKTYGPGAGR